MNKVTFIFIFLAIPIFIITGNNSYSSLEGMKSPNKQGLNFQDNKIITFEGTVVSQSKDYFVKRGYESCLVEVNTIFQGEIKESIIEIFSLKSNLPRLPIKNTTAIFKIGKIDDYEYDGFKILNTLTHYPMYFGIGMPQEVINGKLKNNYSCDNLEIEVYQKIEKECGQFRKRIKLPATLDEVAISHSRKNSLLIPNRKIGVVYKINPVLESKETEYIGFSINVSSSNIPIYLENGYVEIEYNTMSFGENIVANNRLKFNVKNNYSKPYSSFCNGIPMNYKVQVEDVSTNKIGISFKKSTEGGYLQLLQVKTGVLLGELYLKPFNNQELTGIRIFCESETSNTRFDYFNGNSAALDYVACEKTKDYYSRYFLPVVVKKVTCNKALNPGDLVTVIGENFGNRPFVSLYSTQNEFGKRYMQVPQKYILLRSDSWTSSV